MPSARSPESERPAEMLTATRTPRQADIETPRPHRTSRFVRVVAAGWKQPRLAGQASGFEPYGAGVVSCGQPLGAVQGRWAAALGGRINRPPAVSVSV